MHKSSKVLTFSVTPKLFAGVGSAELREILDAAEIRKVGARRIIITAGESATHLFLLLSGDVRFYRLTRNGDNVLLTRLVSGEAFGLGSLLSGPVQYIGTAEATHNSELLVWKQTQILTLARKYPRLAENALGIILRYLAAFADRLVDLVTCNAEQRLARVMFLLGKHTGKIAPTGVEIKATNEELSELANVSTFTASRLLNRWARAGAVVKSRGRVFINTPEKLLVD